MHFVLCMYVRTGQISMREHQISLVMVVVLSYGPYIVGFRDRPMFHHFHLIRLRGLLGYTRQGWANDEWRRLELLGVTSPCLGDTKTIV